ncbi:hypothetical protein Pla110_24330 [Polystyrenella longa]|uniref:Phage-related minor tail protein n=1 Tax=Polystyrenella longa TaxID=2528007 RepID=A0A518CN91_9PLAN|nr:hypothetical protein [Polystyrenella longa]QDU80701.1 hypothetical protein Pla110_24330 [Polystyrenella longa]
MATIGDIVVNLGVDRRGFTSGMDQASSKLKSFGGMAKSGLGMAAKGIGIGMAAAGAATAAAAAVIIPNVSKAMDSIDELAKTSDKLGIGIENLAGLRHAAELTGTATSTLDNGIRKMVNNVSEAAGGIGSAKTALEELGLSAESLSKLSPDEQFLAISGAMQGVENSGERLRMTLDVFGRSGADLVNILNGGPDAIKAMMAEVDELGMSVSRMDAAKVEAANDAWTRMSGVIDGLWNKLAVELAPSLEALITSFVLWGTEGSNASDLITAGVRALAVGIGVTVDIINGLTGVWQMAQAGASKALAWILSGVNKLAEGISYLGGLIGMDFDTSFLKDMADEMHKLADADVAAANDKFLGALSGEFTKSITSKFDEVNQKANETAKLIADTAANNINAVDSEAIDLALQRTQELEKAAQSVFDSTRTPMEKFEKEAAKLQELFAAGLIDENTLGRALTDAKESVFSTIDVGEVKATADLTQNTAVQKGSQEAFKRLMEATIGPKQDTEQAKALKVQERQESLLAQINAAIQKSGGTGGLTLTAANF